MHGPGPPNPVLVQLQMTKTISIRGFYAQRWPEYLEEKMGLKPVDDQNIPGSTWSRMLKVIKKGTEGGLCIAPPAFQIPQSAFRDSLSKHGHLSCACNVLNVLHQILG